MIIYLHGWNSSALSTKARQTVEYCAERNIECIAPTLSTSTSVAIQQVLDILKKHPNEQHTLVGSSMGGYYTTWLCENNTTLRGVLINPAVKLAEKLAAYENTEQKNYHSDETYLFTTQHLDEMRALEIPTITHPHRYLLMVQKGDELLDYREAVNYYADAQHIIEDGGDHMFCGYEKHLQTIIDFTTTS